MNLEPAIPSWPDIKQAAKRISPYIHQTPVFSSSYFNKLTNSELFFKCENFQKVGAFKARGAINTVLSLSDDEVQNGVTTHSSGNHAQAVSWAARIREIKATIVMPRNAPRVKINAVRGYGAEIVFCEPALQAREETAKSIVEKRGACFIHPYNNPGIISGQGTVAKEFLEEIPDLDLILTPVGGGGLLSGTAIAAKYLIPSIRVIGAEPELADDAYRSFRSGILQPAQRTDTIADGLRTSLGDLTFRVIRQAVDNIVTVPEASIIRDMRTVWERMKMVIEPSSAVPLSAIVDGKIDVAGKKAGIILTGGNVDLDKLPWMD